MLFLINIAICLYIYTAPESFKSHGLHITIRILQHDTQRRVVIVNRKWYIDSFSGLRMQYTYKDRQAHENIWLL